LSLAVFLRKVRRRLSFERRSLRKRYRRLKVWLNDLRVRWVSGLLAAIRETLFRIASIDAQHRNKLSRFKSQSKIDRRKGALFVGYAEGNLGLGQVFRNNLQAAQAVALPFGIYPFRIGIETRLLQPFIPERYDKAHAYDVNIILVATEQMPNVLRSVDARLLSNSYNVLQTFWELAKAPEAWRRILGSVDEIWAPSTFVANAFRPIFSGPINLVPPVVDLGEAPAYDRDHFGMIPNRFYFMFSFDYHSSPYRKNPIGTLQAFQRAFRNNDENTGLIIKSIGNLNRYAEITAELRQAAAADPRIILIERNMSRAEILGLICASDAYISLHRSEGFGMGMAEAMKFGRIVIATDYSGSTDFLTQQTGYPIPFRLRPIAVHEYPWSDEQFWAEPDISSAAATMQEILKSPHIARERADAGQKFVQKKYGTIAIGEIMKARICHLMERERDAS
jgi:glycosyltransferase involved in cell wall biosynthesis